MERSEEPTSMAPPGPEPSWRCCPHRCSGRTLPDSRWRRCAPRARRSSRCSRTQTARQPWAQIGLTSRVLSPRRKPPCARPHRSRPTCAGFGARRALRLRPAPAHEPRPIPSRTRCVAMRPSIAEMRKPQRPHQQSRVIGTCPGLSCSAPPCCWLAAPGQPSPQRQPAFRSQRRLKRPPLCPSRCASSASIPQTSPRCSSLWTKVFPGGGCRRHMAADWHWREPGHAGCHRPDRRRSDLDFGGRIQRGERQPREQDRVLMGCVPFEGAPTAIVVRKDLAQSGQVRTAADLKGRKMGLVMGATGGQAYELALVLREVGLRLKDVFIVTFQTGAETLAALKAGSIDAAYFSTPGKEEGVQQGIGVVLSPAKKPGHCAVGTVFGAKFISERPEQARAVMVSLVRAARDIQGGRFKTEDNLAILSKYTKLPVETVRAADVSYFPPDLAPDVDTVLDVQSVYMAEGLLTYSTPLRA